MHGRRTREAHSKAEALSHAGRESGRWGDLGRCDNRDTDVAGAATYGKDAHPPLQVADDVLQVADDVVVFV